MKRMQGKMQNQTSLLGYLLLLTSFFIFLEISFLIQCSGFYLGDFKFVTAHLQIPWKVLPPILFFLFAQLFIHLVFTVIVWAVACLGGFALNLAWDKTQHYGFFLWIWILLTVLFANQVYFPNSRFAELTAYILHPVFAKWLTYIFVFPTLIAFMLACVGLCMLIMENKLYLKASLITLFSIVIISITVNQLHQPSLDAATGSQPNIILIGVDSLRPDALGYFSGSKRSPNIDTFLSHAVVFTQAITPLARTFPAWVSILTGEYPKKTGARFDLADPTHLQWEESLPAILKQHGYHTIYAMDETRFSNIEADFGFDQIITPPVGLNDFLLGTFNDFPLSNFVVNTKLGEWLFPYSYGNRPAFVTYDPNSFLQKIKPALFQSRKQPLFLAIHFCLPHSPYGWASYNVNNKKYFLNHYKASIKRVDKQVNDFLAMLKKANLLEHSVIVLLSDHGEALELKGDRLTQAQHFLPGYNKSKVIPRFYPPAFDYEQVNQSAGHGTDVLGMTQYHSVLAFQFHGIDFKPTVNKVQNRVSLMDIKPTLLALLKIKSAKTDGIALIDTMAGRFQSLYAKQDLFIESDFSPQSVRSVHPETRQVLFEGIDYFQLNTKTLKFIVKKSMGDLIISSKQHADIYGDWMLALYPQAHNLSTPILINLKTLGWTNDLHSTFAKRSPVKHMLHALRQFYGAEIKQVQNA